MEPFYDRECDNPARVSQNRPGDHSMLGGGDSGEMGRFGIPIMAYSSNVFHGKLQKFGEVAGTQSTGQRRQDTPIVAYPASGKEPALIYDGSRRETVDMGFNDFILELFFRTDTGRNGGNLVSKSDSPRDMPFPSEQLACRS